MKVLELFAGSCSFTNVAKEYGFETFTTDHKHFEGIDYVTDFFGFDKDLKLKYRGRIDSGVMNANQDSNIERDLFNAMIKIKNEGVGPTDQINSVGCSIKWK